MFLNAVNCPEVKSKGMMNLAMVYLKQGENRAAQGDLPAAKDLAMKAGNYLDDAKVLLDETIKNGLGAGDEQRYVLQFGPLRLQSHRLVGSVLFGLKDFAACEEEFREATKNFPDIRGAWEMLARVLDLQGKSDEVAKVREQINKL
jgi:tetratricopeptide (TPR) repeat protein